MRKGELTFFQLWRSFELHLLSSWAPLPLSYNRSCLALLSRSERLPSPAMIALGRLEKDGSSALQYLLARPPLTVLAGFSIVYLFLLQFCRWTSSRDPTSYFFDPASAYKPIYSNVRIKEADSFIENAEVLPRPRTSGEPLTMCIGVSTLAREGEQYVRRTIGSLMEGLSELERRSVYLTVLVAHSQPRNHPISEEIWTEHIPNKVLHYNNELLETVRQLEEAGSGTNKTLFDYTYLMNECQATGAKYIAMIEDDTLAVKGWYSQTLAAMTAIEKEMEKEKRGGQEWGFLRLFYVEDYFGWNREYWKTYLWWSFVVWGTIITGLIIARAHDRSKTTQTYLSNPCMAVIAGICIPAIVSLFFMAGRNTIRPLAPGIHEMNKFPCCSQGYVFPSHIVPRFLQRAESMTDWPIDKMSEAIADHQSWVRWAQTPSLLQHIGRSELSRGAAQWSWNFGFEMYQKSRLGRG
jgi:hypothetical protein